MVFWVCSIFIETSESLGVNRVDLRIGEVKNSRGAKSALDIYQSEGDSHMYL